MVTAERLREYSGKDQKKPVAFSEWLNKVVIKRRFNLDEAFAKDKRLLEELVDPEDKAYLNAIGEARAAYIAGDPTLKEQFPKDYSRKERLARQLKTVHNATPVPEWQNAIVKKEALVLHGEIKPENGSKPYNPIG